ncbi:winged helix-turn-helix domain-containing protein [Jiangella anatolica]|uniref:winged helix-turn-helix domain-containing protein n=1 Tax=Jiangella anatolica TaxID=2670374 RepID=UPI0011B84AA3|nr:winged helix-turn-helix domain-containing protein [Jiangella anatolica]
MVSAAPYIESITPYVICVGTTLEDSTAIARAIDRRAIVMIAPDTKAARRLLVAEDGVPDSPAGVEDLETRVIERGCLRVDLVSRQVTWGDVDIALSAREFDLLATLAGEAGRVWSFEELTSRIWKTRYRGDADPVVSAVKRLRRRLASVVDELRVVSVRGIGFRLVVPD